MCIAVFNLRDTNLHGGKAFSDPPKKFCEVVKALKANIVSSKKKNCSDYWLVENIKEDLPDQLVSLYIHI